MLSTKSIVVAVVATAALLGPASSRAGYYPVGSEGVCLATFAEAVAAAGGDPAAEIRLTTGSHETGTVTITQGLVIRGGYDTCQSPQPTPGAVSTLTNRSGRVLRIDGTRGDGRLGVIIEGVDLTGLLYWSPGSTEPSGTAGGMTVLGPVDLTLRDVHVYASHAYARGGALSLLGHALGSPRVTVEDSLFAAVSSSQEGGAISCVGGALSIRESDVEHGHAGNDGGGIYASSCDLSLEDVSIYANTAESTGGGVYVVEGASLPTTLTARRVTFRGNDGSNSGGGLYVGAGTEATLVDVKLYDNLAPIGAAVYVYGSDVSFGGRACTLAEAHDPTAACSGVGRHRLLNPGSVVAVRGGSHVRLGPVLVTGIEGGHGTAAIWVTNSELAVVGGVLTDNQVLRLVSVEGDAGSVLRLEHATIHGNTVAGAHFRFGEDPTVPGVPSWEIVSSILLTGYQGIVDSSSNFTYGGRCVVGDEPMSIPDFVRANAVGISADGIHLLPGSIAMDVCDPYPGEGPDVDGEIFGFDHPDAVNRQAGTRSDAGADEVDGLSPTIFGDGFESGGTGAWQR